MRLRRRHHLPITRHIPSTELFSHKDAPVKVTRLDVDGEGIFYSIDVWATIGHGDESRYIELFLDEDQFVQLMTARLSGAVATL